MTSTYLDYAATSAVRPDCVADAVAEYLRATGATPGRSGHRLSIEAGRTALRCRLAIARLLGVPGDPGRIVFQMGATHALNTALFGTLQPGDRVVRSQYDHNSVRRPVAALRARGIEEHVLAGNAAGELDLDEAERALEGRDRRTGGRPARLLVVTHASNVLGNVLPVAELAERARAVGARVLVDAAQTAGHTPFSVDELGVDLLAVTGHKGMLGPQGIGALWVREGVEVDPLLFGGTGSDSWSDSMPDAYPDRLEAGTQNGPGIAGLLVATEWLLEHGVAEIHARAARLKRRMLEALLRVPAVRVHSPPAPEGAAIVTLTVAGIAAAEVARRLDRDYGIMTRAGLHCAPEAHELIGTEGQGAVRFSFGWASTDAEVDRAVAALAAIGGNAAAGSAVPIPDPAEPEVPGERVPPGSERGANGTW